MAHVESVQHSRAIGSAVDAARADGCTGLIVFVAGRANTGRLAALLAASGVKDAVQVDGGDSLMLGYRTTVLIGRMMPWKRSLQCWGIQFRPRETAPDSRERR